MKQKYNASSKPICSMSLNVRRKSTLNVQGYPQRIILQRRLYGINTACFLIFRISCNYKCICFYAQSLERPYMHIHGRILYLTLEMLYLKSCRSSLQSHPLWVTMYMKYIPTPIPPSTLPTSIIGIISSS